MGPKTYHKGHPYLIARLQVRVSGVWQLLWLLAIQLMTFLLLWPISTPITRQSQGNPGMFGRSHDRRYCFETAPGMSRRMLPTCAFVTMAPLFYSSSDASCYVRDMCPDPALPRWMETILGVCSSGLKGTTWVRPLLLKIPGSPWFQQKW